MSKVFSDWLENRKVNNIKNDIIQMTDLVNFINNVKALIFPGYVKTFECYDKLTADIKSSLIFLLRRIEVIEEITLDVENIVDKFFDSIPLIDSFIEKDIEALYSGDPAAASKTEIILCYPGLRAIFIYRVAHVLYELNIPILPRALSEYAHGKTGIDIHPGATIGEYFFIDHGTGIVIGQTCVIGNNVKIYQGVTLGALSLREGSKLKGAKRHPTIKDNVTIYSGASIFGGDTIIGENTTIGSSAFITSSVEDNMLVTIQGQKKKRL